MTAANLTAIAWGVAIVCAVPLLILAAELVAGIAPARRAGCGGTDHSVAIIMPAHDEAAGIGKTLTALSQVVPPGTRIVVIADNCTDQTAALARAAGAEVVERQDTANRGKGFALARGRDYLAEGNPPDVALVLDADCWLTPGSIQLLARTAIAKQAPAQAIYLFETDAATSPMVQISNFAMMVKNLVRSRGMQRLGGPALLTGSGMAFPWPLFATADLATGSIVEDLALGIEMTRAGHAPYLVEGAHVRSAPAALSDALQQRKRWEHGFLDTLRRQALPVLWNGLKRSNVREIQLGLHLVVPPLALLMVMAVLAVGLLGIASLAGASIVPLLALGTLLGSVIGLILIVWIAAGRPFLTPGGLMRAPLYILWKLPMYASFLKKPEANWVRTPRQP